MGTVPYYAPFSDTRLQKFRDLDIRVRRHSVKVIETGTIQQIHYGLLLVFYRNFAPKTPFLRYNHLRKIGLP